MLVAFPIGKPVSTPDQVRGRLFPGNALTKGPSLSAAQRRAFWIGALGRNKMKKAVIAIGCLVASAAFPALAQDKVFVGHLADYTGATSFVGKTYGPGVRDAVDFINANGGAAGTTIDMETVDYAYKIPDAIANYKP